MALADFTPNRTTITLKKDVTVSVRGLSLNDISQILHTHLADLSHILDMYEKVNGGPLTQAKLFDFILKLVTDAPALVAHVIAIAADEPQFVDKAQMLGLQKQIEIVHAVGALTVEDFGEVKKLAAGLQGAIKGLPKAEQLETAS